jgi:hypothetical protein
MIREINSQGSTKILFIFNGLTDFIFFASYLLNKWADFDACCCIEKLRICLPRAAIVMKNRVKTKDLQSVQKSQLRDFSLNFPRIAGQMLSGIKDRLRRNSSV